MLFLLFQVGPDRFALEASRIVEVVPLVHLRRIPHAPRGVAGLFRYRGQVVPAVDLTELLLNRPAAERLSTRIIIVTHPDDHGNPRLLGLVAEQVTDLLRKEASEFPDKAAKPGPVSRPSVIADEHGVIQWIHEGRLLSDNVRGLLFAEAARLSHESD